MSEELLLILGIILGVIVVLFAICLFRALKAPSRKPYHFEAEVDMKLADEYAKKLSAMVQQETVSNADDQDLTKFYEFHKFLEMSFPNIHKVCEKHDFDGSLLFKWKGESAKDPILLMHHFDVVEATGAWTYPPFAGEIIDGKIYGRGTVDNKGPLFVMLQAIEESIMEGFVPAADIYLASSCTEEIGGKGAPLTVQYLKDQGIKLRMLLDEGGMVIDSPLPMLDGTFAMLGVVEKGYGDLKFIAKSTGGHASAPGKNTPLVRLGKFMAEIEDKNPFRIELTSTLKEMIRRISPELPLKAKFFTENLWLFSPLIKVVVKQVPTLAAMTRTTLAFTKASGSEGYNVLPQEAYVTGNIRYIPHQANAECLGILKRIASKYDIEIEVIYDGVPAPVVDYQSDQFKLVEEIINEVYPNVVVTPYTMTGGTDARFYGELTADGIRFAPLFINTHQLDLIHGIDENIDVASLPLGVEFYKKLIRKI